MYDDELQARARALAAPLREAAARADDSWAAIEAAARRDDQRS